MNLYETYLRFNQDLLDLVHQYIGDIDVKPKKLTDDLTSPITGLITAMYIPPECTEVNIEADVDFGERYYQYFWYPAGTPLTSILRVSRQIPVIEKIPFPVSGDLCTLSETGTDVGTDYTKVLITPFIYCDSRTCRIEDTQPNTLERKIIYEYLPISGSFVEQVTSLCKKHRIRVPYNFTDIDVDPTIERQLDLLEIIEQLQDLPSINLGDIPV